MNRVLLCAVLLAASLPAPAGAAQPLKAIEVTGTRFEVTTESGKVLPQGDLVGAVLSYTDEAGHPIPVRIDRVEPDPKDKSDDILLYGFSVQGADGAWNEMCAPDPDGVRAGFPVQLGGGQGFVLTCTSGAQGKCVRFGYKPWANGPHGEALMAYWQSCIRMVRADYCGDGTPHTRDGTEIDVFDKADIQKDDPAPGMEFEAAWSPEGAVCVRRVRISEIFSLDALRAACPRLKAEDIGAGCTEERMSKASGAPLMNRSYPK
jgi:ADYC domain